MLRKIRDDDDSLLNVIIILQLVHGSSPLCEALADCLKQLTVHVDLADKHTGDRRRTVPFFTTTTKLLCIVIAHSHSAPVPEIALGGGRAARAATTGRTATTATAATAATAACCRGGTSRAPTTRRIVIHFNQKQR